MRYVNLFFYTIFVSLLLGVAGLLIGSMLPIPGNIELKIVKSGSMEPNIPTGSLVVVKPAAAYSIGDVITFGADTRSEIPTTHRIVSFAGEDGQTMYTTKGDANEEVDPKTTLKNDVIGKVVFHMPYVGFVLDFARQPLGFALLIGIPAALVIMEEVFAIAKEVKVALRRRRGDEEGDDEQKGGHAGGESDEPTRLVYLRKRAMDEIFVPMFVEPMVSNAHRLQKSLGMHQDAYGTATTLVLGLVFVSSLMSGGASGTMAYFSDIESSIGNVFGAGAGWETPVIPEIDLVPEVQALVAEGPAEGEVLGESTDTPSPEPESLPPVEPEPESGQTAPNEPIDPEEEEAAQTAPIEPVDASDPAPEPAPESVSEPTQESIPAS